MEYKYETHCHTSEGSKCGKVSAKELVGFYVSKGYTGIVITDHFIGNTTVPPYYNWKNRVDYFCKGYNAAHEEGKKLGLDVFFSLEYSDTGNDFLLYGIEPEFLLENPDMGDIGMTKVLRRARDAGAFIIHAHPFLQAYYIDSIRLVPSLIDAVEVVHGGGGSGKEFTRRNMFYAEEYGLLKTGGTDTHHFDIEGKLTGIALEHRAENILDLAAQIKAGKSRVLEPV